MGRPTTFDKDYIIDQWEEYKTKYKLWSTNTFVRFLKMNRSTFYDTWPKQPGYSDVMDVIKGDIERNLLDNLYSGKLNIKAFMFLSKVQLSWITSETEQDLNIKREKLDKLDNTSEGVIIQMKKEL